MESTFPDAGAQPGLILIETVLWTGTAAPRWPLHLARLLASAAALGWPAPQVAAPLGPKGRPARLRLTCDAAGQAEWQVAPLPPAKPLWSVALAQARYASGDPWLRLKSSNRSLQDATRAALPADVDELLFANERDEICEGTITTIFFDRGQGLRTPPLSCGLLPGVLRREIAAPEEVLTRADLPHVGLWVGNALRGLIPARFSPDP